MTLDLQAHERIDALSRRVEALERALIRPFMPPREFVNTCEHCGLEFEPVRAHTCTTYDRDPTL